MLTLTYEYKIKPTNREKAIFEDWLEISRKVYNYALSERKAWFKSRSCQINACSLHSEYIIPADAPRPTYYHQSKSLTAAKKEIPELRRVQSQVLQQTLIRLEKAFVSMWEHNHGFPRFKKPGAMRCFVFPQLKHEDLLENQIRLPLIGWVIFRPSRPIPEGGKLKQARIVKRASGWFVMLTLQWDVSVPSPMPHSEALGIDVGLTNFIAASNGLNVKRPKFFVDLQRKLKLLQQRVSRKKLGSSNWRKAQMKVQRLHEHIANTRKDFHWKVAHQLCDQAQTIFVEDLNLVGLSRSVLGKHCLDAGWGQFFQILEQCCFKRGVYFQKINSRKTSQICPNCQTETGKKMLSERVHVCSNCGYTTDRDVAAAQIVCQRGLAAVGYTVKMLGEGKFIGIRATQESPDFLFK
ncbi:putative transposase IS605 family protein [Tolypothrix sp. NIES-4075]|uniref:RNA-guided endonuclease InsQ/TnpB family protein n=1 Tax=Tolypothrix sp. NIES-4075 TaxID=2005459 RepID=UPI000B5C22EF|nr:RNA-guided endonuclease TnpB family protein [Tolypothrix sp. NIES-4075]GAX44140.1 putative transposase IS605 family protein [Tolypothrix sp. NIES-4075]